MKRGCYVGGKAAGPVLLKLKRHAAIQAVQALKFGEGYNPYNLVMCRADGLPMSTSALDKQYNEQLKLASLPNIRFHDTDAKTKHSC